MRMRMIITMILSVMLITMNIRVTRSMKVTMIQIVTFRERRETETPYTTYTCEVSGMRKRVIEH